MTDLLFADTNILVYALDPRDPAKRAKAKAFLEAAADDGSLVTSPQTISECYRVLTERRSIDPRTARLYLETFEWTCRAPLDWHTVELAWEVQDRSRLNWWDSLMLAAAVRAGCAIFATEDLHAGTQIGNLLIVNPFTDDLSRYLA